MGREIGTSEASKYGINVKHEVMDNQEKRFRLISDDGSSYIRTESAPESGWQNSHYHKKLKEMYIVQDGWVVFAELKEGRVEFKGYKNGEHFVCQPGISHNLFVSENTVLHTVKYGTVSGGDWYPDPELDELSKCKSQKEIEEYIVK